MRTEMSGSRGKLNFLASISFIWSHILSRTHKRSQTHSDAVSDSFH